MSQDEEPERDNYAGIYREQTELADLEGETDSPSVASNIIQDFYKVFIVLLLTFATWAVAEETGRINLIQLSPPYTLDVVTSILAGALSVTLTLFLVILYIHQTSLQKRQIQIQANQRALMEQEIRPLIRADLEIVGDDTPLFIIENTGQEAGIDVEAEWSFINYQTEWKSPYLSTGRRIMFPLIELNDSEKLSVEYINMVLDPNQDNPMEFEDFDDDEFDSKLSWEVTCEDIAGNQYQFSEEINALEAFDRLEQASSSSEVETLEDIRDEVNNVAFQIEDINNPLT